MPSCGGMAPTKWLVRKSSTSKLGSAPSSGGMAPVSLLCLRRSTRRFLRLPSCGGMAPFKALFDKNRLSSLVSCPNSGGIRPESSTPRNLRACTRAGLPPTLTPCQAPRGLCRRQFSAPLPKVSLTASSRLQSATKPRPACADMGQNQFLWRLRSADSRNACGTPLAKSLPCKSSCRKFDKAASRGGGVPLSALLDKSRDSKFCSLANSVGMGPVNSLLCKCSWTSWSSCPSSGGIWPLRPLSPKCRLCTRGGSPSMAMPFHQPMGADLRQSSLPPPAKAP